MGCFSGFRISGITSSLFLALFLSACDPYGSVIEVVNEVSPEEIEAACNSASTLSEAYYSNLEACSADAGFACGSAVVSGFTCYHFTIPPPGGSSGGLSPIALTLSPMDYDFGAIYEGGAVRSLQLANNGGREATHCRVAVTNPAAFEISPSLIPSIPSGSPVNLTLKALYFEANGVQQTYVEVLCDEHDPTLPFSSFQASSVGFKSNAGGPSLSFAITQSSASWTTLKSQGLIFKVKNSGNADAVNCSAEVASGTVFNVNPNPDSYSFNVPRSVSGTSGERELVLSIPYDTNISTITTTSTAVTVKCAGVNGRGEVQALTSTSLSGHP